MTSRGDIVRRILAYLNGDITLPDLVQWSEDPDAVVKMRILGYIGAGDTPDFPLTWEVLSSFLHDLDTHVRVVETAA
jgi:hypothetical protein